MNSLAKKLDLSANVAIIGVALLIGVFFVRNYLVGNHAVADSHDRRIPMGAKVSLPDVDWAKSDRTLLIALRPGCRFCTESAPFYQRLVREAAANNNVRLIAVMSQDVEAAKQYLSDLSVSVKEVRQAPLGSIHIKGTPTLILVDRAGSIIGSWVGKLSADEEIAVLSRL